MLKELYLENFRGFNKHSIPFKEFNIVVGQNNAGKTSIVEALRLLSIVAQRYKKLAYNPPQAGTGIPRDVGDGISPSLRNMEINFKTLFYQYQDPPSIIKGVFQDGTTVTIYLGKDESIHATIKNKDGYQIINKYQALHFYIPPISIMPQVAPVAKEEKILNEDYIKSSLSSPLSPLHFRNQLKIFYDLFPKFKNLVEETWGNVRVEELLENTLWDGGQLFLEIRNEAFVGEISLMGHGLQMWLQTMWFLTLAEGSATVILDEPDVYMHADLQRQLVRLLKNRYPQIILTTHSVEIMSEAQPEEIVIIDRKRPKSKFATSLPAVQRVIESVGSVQNIHLTRLWNTKRFILVEGKDIKILKQFQNTLFPSTKAPFDALPGMSIGGWGGWNYAVGSNMMLKNALNEDIIPYCILDSDYHIKKEIVKREKDAKEKGVQLHIWERKEIENYLLSDTAIHRIISRNVKGKEGPSLEKVRNILNKIASKLEESSFDAISTEVHNAYRHIVKGKANEMARKIMKEKSRHIGLLAIVSGKTVLSKLSGWSQKCYGVQINPNAVAKEMTRSELPEEIVRVVSAIENETLFD